MITNIEKYHGAVLRQIVVNYGGPLTISVADRSGRIDSFAVADVAFQIKHSSKRLPPWQFTFPADQLEELFLLAYEFRNVWLMLVCGIDGISCVRLDELRAVCNLGENGATSVRVSREKNAMYRLTGGSGTLSRAIPRGIESFVDDAKSGRI